MKSKQLKNSLILLTAAFIWGVAFVAQSVGMDYVKPFTFNASRYLIAVIPLIPAALIFDRAEGRKPTLWGTQDKKARKDLIVGGSICGVIMAVGAALQQYGVMYTSVGKAGFITTLYIVFVPILGVFLHKKLRFTVWISVAIATLGMYFLCMKKGDFSISTGDTLILLCAVVYSLHIIVIDIYAPKVDAIRFSVVQLFVAGVLSAIPMLIFDKPQMSDIFAAWLPILYAGLLSSGVAFTLQIIGQRGLNPTLASLIMSLESVFAVLAGSVVLHEQMSMREILGCAFMFAAIVLSQLPERKNKKITQDNQKENNETEKVNETKNP